MAEAENFVGRVLKLKEQLRKTQDPQKVMKSLKTLQNLNMSLDLLVETGIGKTVNGFRKHSTAGDLAKALVNQWKQLISSENESRSKEKKRDLRKGKDSKKKPFAKEDKLSEKSVASKRTRTHELSSESAGRKFIAKTTQKGGKNKSSNRLKVKECKSDPSEKISGGHESKNLKASHPESHKKRPPEMLSFLTATKKEEKVKSSAPQVSGSIKRPSQSLSMEKSKIAKPERDETPTLPFEYYLNYDQVSHKRKMKFCLKRGQHC